MDEPRCTVGLLTWNAGEDGPRCVESVVNQSEDVRIDWIDNGSTDGTVGRLRGRFGTLPEPTINIANRGFCVPHNQMLARCTTPYYLALNQDVVLGPRYVTQLCNWMDEEPDLPLAMGLILMPGWPYAGARMDLVETLVDAFGEGRAEVDAPPTVHSAGLVFPRARYHFQLGMGRPLRAEWVARRRVPGVDGAAMMLNVEACRRIALDGEEVFAAGFFAYYEEVDLAHRFARVGYPCGIHGGAVAMHRGKGSGGHGRAAIRARFFANHWLVTLRNEPWPLILRELPYLLRGELRFWLPEYLRAPGAFLRAVGALLREAAAARRFYREFETAHGPTLEGLTRYREASLEAVRGGRNSK
jgi:GT2 family glycosyltransferase